MKFSRLTFLGLYADFLLSWIFTSFTDHSQVCWLLFSPNTEDYSVLKVVGTRRML